MATVRLIRRQSDKPQRAALIQSSIADRRVSRVTIQTTDPIRLADGTTRIGKWIFPYAPNDVVITGLSDVYEQLARPGRLPIVERAARNPLQVSISSIVVARNATSTAVDPIDDELMLLRRIARSGVNLIIGGRLLGRLHHGVRFRMTDFQVDSVRRNPQQRLIIANVTLGLLQVSPITQTVPGMVAVADLPPTQRASGGGGGGGDNENDPLSFVEWLQNNPNSGRTALVGFAP